MPLTTSEASGLNPTGPVFTDLNSAPVLKRVTTVSERPYLTKETMGNPATNQAFKIGRAHV